MKIEEKFNKRNAALLEVQPPSIHTGAHYDLGMQLTFYQPFGKSDMRTIAMHMTPDEALSFAHQLLDAIIKDRNVKQRLAAKFPTHTAPVGA